MAVTRDIDIIPYGCIYLAVSALARSYRFRSDQEIGSYVPLQASQAPHCFEA